MQRTGRIQAHSEYHYAGVFCRTGINHRQLRRIIIVSDCHNSRTRRLYLVIIPFRQSQRQFAIRFIKRIILGRDLQTHFLLPCRKRHLFRRLVTVNQHISAFTHTDVDTQFPCQFIHTAQDKYRVFPFFNG